MKASDLKDHKKLVNLHYMTRDDVVPFYKDLIARQAPDEEVKRINNLILSKWKPSGLIYIKERAWKGELMENWANGVQTEIIHDL